MGTPTNTLRAFLESRRVSSADWNITGMGTDIGKYTIADDDYGEFLQLYHDAVFTQGRAAAILERHSPVASPILIDLDFRYAAKEGRQYDPAAIATFVAEYATALHKFIEFGDELRFFVQETPGPRVEQDTLKDGIHIICPDITMQYDDLFTLRKYVLDQGIIQKCFPTISNTDKDCFDESVIKRNNWFLYGSSKSPDRTPYTVSRCFVLSPDGVVSEETVAGSTVEYVCMFSIRTDAPSSYKIRDDATEEWNTWKAICDKKPKASTTSKAEIAKLINDTESVSSHLSENISKIIRQPGLIWDITEVDKGYKLTHNSKRCLIAEDVEHSALGHSCVFVSSSAANLVCFSHKTKKLPKTIATALWNILSGNGGATTDELTEQYTKLKAAFEQNVFRILDPPGYMVSVCDKWIHYTRAQLIDMNSGIFIDDDKKVRFIDQWLRDDSIRTYARTDYYVDAAECPPMVFNTFKGFTGQQTASTHIEDVDITPIIHHLSILCNHKKDEVEYLLDWFAVIVQKPSFINGVAVVFMGPQGCGKDTFLSWFSNDIIGTGNYFRTVRPQVDLFGSFNTSRKNVVFYHIEEGNSDAMTKENVEQFKSYITDSHAAIQAKNQNTTAGNSLVRNYNHFAISTNNNVPFHIDINERRFFAVRASPEVSRNWTYFAKLRATMSEPAVIATFYRFLMARPVELRDWCDMPASDALTTWKTECQPKLTPFIEWLISPPNPAPTKDVPIKIKASELYAKYYLPWCTSTMEIDEDILSSTSFGVELKAISRISKKHTVDGNFYFIA